MRCMCRGKVRKSMKSLTHPGVVRPGWADRWPAPWSENDCLLHFWLPLLSPLQEPVCCKGELERKPWELWAGESFADTKGPAFCWNLVFLFTSYQLFPGSSSIQDLGTDKEVPKIKKAEPSRAVGREGPCPLLT